MINKLNKWDLNCSVFNSYDFDDCMSLNELLCRFFTKINEVVNNVNEYTNLVKKLNDWIREEGLQEAVNNELDRWLKEGIFDNIINEKIFNDIKEEISNNSVRIEEINNSTLDNKELITNIYHHIDEFKSHLITDNGFDDWVVVFEKALNSGFNIILDYNKVYKISRPIQAKIKQPYNSFKITLDLNNSTIQKIGSEKGVGISYFREPLNEVSYEKDAIIIMELPESKGYTGGLKIINGTLKGDSGNSKSYCDYGIYMPYITHFELNNVCITDCMTAIYSESMWLVNFDNVTCARCRGGIHLMKTGTSININNFWCRDGNDLPINGEYVANEVYLFNGLEYPSVNTLICERQDNITLFKFDNCHGGTYNLSSEDTYNVKIIECVNDSNIVLNSLDSLKVVNTMTRNQQSINDIKPLIDIWGNTVLNINLIDLRYSKYSDLVRGHDYSRCYINTSKIENFNYINDIKHYSIGCNIECTNINNSINNLKALGDNLQTELLTEVNNCKIENGRVYNYNSELASFKIDIETERRPLKIIINLKGKCTISLGDKNYNVNNKNPSSLVFFLFDRNIKTIDFTKEEIDFLKIEWIMLSTNMNATIDSINYEMCETISKPKPIKLVGEWVNTGYLNGYDISIASFSLNDFGLVSLSGGVKNGTTGSNIGQLPVFCRPSNSKLFNTVSPLGSFEQTGQVAVMSDGSLKCINGVNTFVSLDGITYYKS